jgi:hypothetical protein
MAAAASEAISSTILSVGVKGSSSSGGTWFLLMSSPNCLSYFSTTDSGLNPMVSPTKVLNFSAAGSAS